MQENLKDEECKNCKYCFTEKYGEGVCKRYPPVLDETFVRNCCHDSGGSASDSMIWWSQPIVMLDSWCGEFKPKHGE